MSTSFAEPLADDIVRDPELDPAIDRSSADRFSFFASDGVEFGVAVDGPDFIAQKSGPFRSGVGNEGLGLRQIELERF